METPTQASRKRAWCALHLFHGHDDEIDVPLGEILQENHFVEPTKQIGTAIWPINDPLNGLLEWRSWFDALQTWPPQREGRAAEVFLSPPTKETGKYKKRNPLGGYPYPFPANPKPVARSRQTVWKLFWPSLN